MKKARMTTTSCGLMFWGGKWDSNPRQPESQSGTLPTELFPPEFEFCGLPGRDRTCDHLLRRQVLYPTELRADRLVSMHVWKLVGVKRFELPTSCSQSRRATRLRYTPGRNRILHEIRKNATGKRKQQANANRQTHHKNRKARGRREGGRRGGVGGCFEAVAGQCAASVKKVQ